eukprot:350621-Chlamydomonas_euryale.AAC.13
MRPACNTDKGGNMQQPRLEIPSTSNGSRPQQAVQRSHTCLLCVVHLRRCSVGGAALHPRGAELWKPHVGIKALERTHGGAWGGVPGGMPLGIAWQGRHRSSTARRSGGDTGTSQSAASVTSAIHLVGPQTRAGPAQPCRCSATGEHRASSATGSMPRCSGSQDPLSKAAYRVTSSAGRR